MTHTLHRVFSVLLIPCLLHGISGASSLFLADQAIHTERISVASKAFTAQAIPAGLIQAFTAVKERASWLRRAEGSKRVDQSPKQQLRLRPRLVIDHIPVKNPFYLPTLFPAGDFGISHQPGFFGKPIVQIPVLHVVFMEGTNFSSGDGDAQDDRRKAIQELRGQIRADFSHTIALPPAPLTRNDPFPPHEVDLMSIVAEDIGDAEQRATFEFAARKAYQRFSKIRRDFSLSSEMRYGTWLQPFTGLLKPEHFGRLVRHWLINEQFFDGVRLIREELKLSPLESITITFTTPASAPIVEVFLRRPDVAALAQRENIVFKIDSVELDMTDGLYQGKVKPVSPLADVGAATYPQYCLVIGDDVMVNYKPGFGDRLLNVVTFDPQEIRSRIEKQISGLVAANNINLSVVYQENGISMEIGNTQFGYSGGTSQISNLRIKPGNARLRVMPMKEAMGALTIYNRAYGNTREWRTPSEVITNTGEIRKRFKTFADFIKQIWSEEEGSGWEFFTLFDNSNVFGNPNYVAFVDGQVFHGVGTEGETDVIQSFDQPFLSLVQFSDGRLEMLEVAYDIDEQKTETTADGVLHKYAKAFKVNRDARGTWKRGDELKDIQAFNGIPMIRNGQPAELTDLIRGGYFSDFRHLVNTPPLQGGDILDFIADGEKRAAIETALQSVKGGLYFGSDQLNADGYALLAQAVNGPVLLKNHLMASVNGQIRTIPLTPDEVRTVLARSKYQEVTSTPKNPGEMRFIGDQLEIYFKPNPYPMLLYGETEGGEIVVQAVGGLSGRVGIAVKEIAAWAQRNHIRNLFVGSQGTGSLASFAPKGKRSPDNLEMVAVVEGGAIQPGSKSAREGSSCVVAFLVKDDSQSASPSQPGGGTRLGLKNLAVIVIGAILGLSSGARDITLHITGFVRSIDMPASFRPSQAKIFATAA